MADEVILPNMAAFDFSAPLNVTIIYDSDEDTNDIVTSLSDKDQKKCSGEESTLEKKISNLTNNKTLETNNLNDVCSVKTVPENKRNCNEVDDRNNNKLEIQSIQKSPNAENNLTNNTATPLNNIDVEVTRKEFEEVRNYIQDLTTVSEHLIMIVNAYQDHARIVNENKNRVDGHLRIQDSKIRYNRFKVYIFQLSYSAVISVILAQETDRQFIETFLNRTVKIANDKNRLQFTVQYIQPFFYELLFWTKQEREYMTNNPANEVQKNKEVNIKNTPTLSKKLSQPALRSLLKLPKPSRKDKKKEKSNILDRRSDPLPAFSTIGGYQEQQSVPIFRIGPPDREVSISVQPKLLHIQNQQMAQITNSQIRPPPPYFHPYVPNYNRPASHYHMNQTNQYANHQVISNFSPNRNVAVQTSVTNNNNHQVNNHTVNDPNKQYSNHVSASNWYPQRPYIDKASQSLNTLREFRIHHSPQIRQEYANYQHQFPSEDKNQSTNLEDICAQNLQYLSPKKIVENGRSVSTDSGVVSPFQLNTGSEQTPGEPVEQTQFAPLITHVTSLNPNAVQIAEGSCQVCGKPTKTKCMGCYQAYYCNYQCESADWSNHMFVCKRSTETQ